MRRSLVLAAAAALAVGGQARADGISYSYVQADLLGAELCSRDDDDDCLDWNLGHGLRASAGIGPHLFGFLDYSSPRFGDDGYLRFTSTSLGLGAHVPLGAIMDLFGGPSFEHFRSKLSFGGSQSRKGWGFTAGLRGALPAEFEWHSSLKYRHIDEVDYILSASLGARRYFVPAFAVGLEYTRTVYEDFTQDMISVNLRYDFGTGR